mmetsp:Transcript_11018/g.45925  ORF Transcript_11018/g.45925 Transcript_11018/m.45925 type:complete len:285 (-) Transcript_11018:2180-3034(-)
MEMISRWTSLSSASARSLARTAAAASPVAAASLAPASVADTSAAVLSPSPPPPAPSTSIASPPFSVSLFSSSSAWSAALAAAAATRGVTHVARKATFDMTGFGAPAKGTVRSLGPRTSTSGLPMRHSSVDPTSPPPLTSAASSPPTFGSSSSRKRSSMGRRMNRRMHSSALFVPTCEATSDQDSPCVSSASRRSRVSWSVQSSCSISASESSSSSSSSSNSSPSSLTDMTLAFFAFLLDAPVATVRRKLPLVVPSGSLPAEKHRPHTSTPPMLVLARRGGGLAQ